MKNGLTAVVCVGETLAEREAGQHERCVWTASAGALADISADDMKKVVIAYEPVWAIGTAKSPATSRRRTSTPSFAGCSR